MSDMQLKILSKLLNEFNEIINKDFNYEIIVKKICNILTNNNIFSSTSVIFFKINNDIPQIMGNNTLELSNENYIEILNHIKKFPDKNYYKINKNSQRFKPFKSIYNKINPKTALLIPMKINNQIIGYFLSVTENQNYYHEDIINLLNIVLNYLAQKLINSDKVCINQNELLNHLKNYQIIFDESPISFIELDFSEIFINLNNNMDKNNIDKSTGNYSKMVRFLTCNKAALEIFECINEHKLMENIHDLCCNYNENLKKIILGFLNGNQHISMYSTIITESNNIKNVKLRASILTENEKKYDRILISIIDVTKRLRNEYELKKFQIALEENPYSVVITDKNGKIEYVNKKFTEITGYTFDDVKYKNPRILQSGKTEKEVFENLWSTVLNGKVWKGVFINKCKNGNLFWENATIAPVYDNQGEIKNFIAIKEDITSQRKLEEMYMQSQKFEALGSLSSGIAHDFNNLLTVILSYTEYLKQIVSEDEEIYSSIIEIDNVTNRAIEIVHQLSDFSKESEETPQFINLNEEMHNLRKMFLKIIGEDIKLQYTLCDEACFIYIDKTHLTQIILNMLANAKDAFLDNHNNKIIQISTNLREFQNVKLNYNTVINGQYVEIKISDNGIGIPEDIKNKIFEPFFTSKPNGSGLGLSTIYKIITKANGYIYVDSEINKGTTFTILFPYIDILSEKNNENKSDTSNDKLSGNESILIVEDDNSLRSIACKTLRKAGFHMFESSTAAEAISLIKRIKIDLVVIDVILPDQNGIELYETIKLINNDLKVIFTSGYQKDVLEKKFTVEICDNFLIKPFTTNTLLEKIKTILND